MSSIPFSSGVDPLLLLENLSVGFPAAGGTALAVEDVGFALPAGRTLCLVGESGCGKSVTALTLAGLLPCPPARIVGGQALFEGRDLLGLSEKERRPLRGSRIGMIFQDPVSSLNPVMRVGEQIAEGLRLHKGLSGAAALAAAVDMLQRVGIPHPEERARDFPHQLSGGMCQRVVIAMALACEPSLIIADEPTTALDVTVRGQILGLLRDLQRARNSAVLLITHDMGVVRRAADAVAVMYSGRIVEQGPPEAVLADPLHPYTKGLMDSLPRADGRERLKAIPGTVPDPRRRPAGCAFHPRCSCAFERCRRESPPLYPCGPGRASRCFLNSPDA